MSDTWQDTGGTQTWDFASQIDEVCDLFEAAWKGGGRPEIKDYLQESPVPARAALLAELIPLDMEYRKRKGESVSKDDYREFLSSAEFTVSPDSTVPLMAGRYRVESGIGEGGMGEVYRVLDPDFNRALAVKVLRKEHQGRADLEARFLEEAQVLSQLQHPGIVPVHEIGRLDDGRPFFAMKLVKGQTLEKLLQDRPRPDHDMPRFLAIFEQICQTMANAHTHGVIHRDLKPSNVMVGAFGEVQVMDWGLAKVLDPTRKQSDAAAPCNEKQSLIATVRSETHGEPTQAGCRMGSLQFMPPEQALGEVDRHDERSDVFMLGGVLCVILTGHAPYEGTTGFGAQQRGELQPAYDRLDACGADKELIDLAKLCLAVKSEVRPRNAEELASAVTAYLESVEQRLRQAEVASAEAKAKAIEERKRRRVTVALAATVLALVVVGALAGLSVQRQWATESAAVGRNRQAVETGLDKARELRQQAHWAEARTVLDQTGDRLGEKGAADLRQQLEQAIADLDLVDRLETIRLRRTTLVEGKKIDSRSTDRDYAAAFHEAGLGDEGDHPDAVAARIRDSAVWEQLVAALDDWAALNLQPQPWVLEVARRADPDLWRDRFRDPNVWRDQAALEALAGELLRDEAQLAKQKPQLLAGLVTGLQRTKADSLPLLAAAQARHPADFWLNLELGNALMSVKQWNEAVGYYLAALALRPESAVPHNNLGSALGEKKQLDRAIREYRTAIDLDPKYAAPHNNLGNALREKKQLDQAIREFDIAIDLDPNYAGSHYNLGNALMEKKQLDHAIREFHIAIDLDPNRGPYHNILGSALAEKKQLDQAIREFQIAVDLDPSYALYHNNLGSALVEKKQLDQAVREFHMAIKFDPKNANFHYNLGVALFDQKQLDQAIREYRTAIELDGKYAPAHNNLGLALADKKQLDEAIREYRTAIDLDTDFAHAYYNLGNALYEKKQLDEAIREYRTAIDLDAKFAHGHYNLGNALADKKQLDEAIREYRTAIDLDANFAHAHYALGNALYTKEQLNDAIREYRAAIELQPDLAEAHCNLAQALQRQGSFVDALAEFRKGHELGSKQLGWPYPSKGWVREAEGLVQLESRIPDLLAGKEKPANDTESLLLAQMCQAYKRLYAASARFYGAAFDHDARLADNMQQQYRYNAACAAALAGCGQGKDADTLDDKDLVRLRNQSRAWLRADLEAWAKLADQGTADDRAAAVQALRHWQTDPDLAGVRDKAALEKLPDAERADWEKLWSDVAELLKSVGEKK